MKNIFICHRPYHILRSANMIYENYLNDENILISYNLIQIESQKYLDYISFPSIESYFSQTIVLNRNDDVRIWSIYKFLTFYRKKIREYTPIVNRHIDFDNLFFFSDMERPIEILVGLFKEKGSFTSQIILVDEGIAAYFYLNKNRHSDIKKLVVKIFKLKYLNPYVQYGASNLYTKALASYPELSTFNGEVLKMPSLNSDFLNKLLLEMNLDINLKHKYILYLSNILDKSFGISRETEMDVLMQIKAIAENCGYMFYIKPHPVQESWYYSDIDQFKSCMVDASLPAELLYSKNGIIVSMGSSGLLNSYMMGIKSIDVGFLFNYPIEWYPKVSRIEMPHSMTELEKIITDY